MREGDVRFIRELVDEFPALRPELDEHVEDNCGEVLGHLFLADCLRLVLATLDDGPRRVSGLDVPRLLGYLELRFAQGEEHLKELISAGFLESLPRADEPGHCLRAMLGPMLRAEAERVA